MLLRMKCFGGDIKLQNRHIYKLPPRVLTRAKIKVPRGACKENISTQSLLESTLILHSLFDLLSGQESTYTVYGILVPRLHSRALGEITVLSEQN